MGMDMAFTPPITGSTTLCVPPGERSPWLVFTATFDDEDKGEHARAVRDGARVEMWADLPAEGRRPGEWGALPFVARAPDGNAPEKPAGAYVLDLTSPREGSAAREGRHWHLNTRIELPDGESAVSYSYTYRLVYPSGRVRWLGDFGRNGVLRIERKDPRIALQPGWSTQEGGRVFQGSHTAVQEIARLNPDICWAFWATVDGRLAYAPSPSDSALERASALVCIPDQPADATTLWQPLLITTSDGTLAVGPEGLLTLSALSPEQPSLALLSSGQDAKAFLDETLSTSLPLHRVIPCDVSGRTIIASPPHGLPVQLTILPDLSCNPSAYTMSITTSVQDLVGTLAEAERSQIVLSEFNGRALYLTDEGDSKCSFIFDPRVGGQLSLAPIYSLRPETEHYSPSIAILDEHQKISHIHDYMSLPSPPLTPPTKPQQRVPEPPATSLDSLPSMLPTITNPPTTTSPATQSSDEPTVIPLPSRPNAHSPSPHPAPRVSRQQRSGPMLTSYRSLISYLVKWLRRALFFQLFAPLPRPEPSSPIIEDISDRAPPIMDQPSPAMLTAAVGQDETVMVPDSKPTRPLISPKSSLRLEKAMQERPLHPSLLFDVPSSKLSLIIRATPGDSRLRWASLPFVGLEIECDGASVSPAEPGVEVGDGLWLVTCKLKEGGGRVKIALKD